MPYECVRCGKIYEESEVMLKGCKCGSKFFYFFKEKPKEIINNLTQEEIKEIEKQIEEIVEIPKDKPVILDIESIRAIKPGKFEIDLVKLFKKHPIIFKIEEGKYIIDIASTFQLKKK